MTIAIAGVSDIVPGRKFKALPNSPFFDHLRNAAVTIANLEVPFTDNPGPAHGGGVDLYTPTAFAAELPKAGITVGTLANNHAATRGPEVLAEMIEACDRAGLRTLGWGANREDASRPLYIDVKGEDGRSHTIAIVAATSIGPRNIFATATAQGVSSIEVVTTHRDDSRSVENPGSPRSTTTEPVEADIVLMEQQVRAAKARTPVVVAALHWGLGESVLEYMKIVSRRLIDAGATIIYGCHTHHMAAVDWYNGAPIFYGLGNFLFQYDGERPVLVPRDGVAAIVDVDPETGAVSGARMLIGRLDAEGVPWPASPDRAERVIEDVERFSFANNVEFEHIPEGAILRPRQTSVK